MGKKDQHIVSFEKRIASGIKKCSEHFDKINLKLILGISGGPDSLSLLYSLHKITQLHPKLFTLYGAHMNHGLRKFESEQDAKFVMSTFENLKIPYYIKNIDSKKIYDQKKGSLEEVMRYNRYSFFGEISNQINADMVVTAHTADDQTETILMNLIRGTGLNGLTGIQQISQKKFENHSFILARPMLEITSEETNEYCKILGLNPRIDKTNHSNRFTRNKIRNEIIPSLEKINPGAKKNIRNLSKIIGDEYKFIKQITDTNFSSISRITKNQIIIDRNDFKKLDLNIKRNIIIKTIETLEFEFKNLQKINIENIINAKTGTELKPTENIMVFIDKNELIFKKKSRIKKENQLLGQKITQTGITKIQDWTIEITKQKLTTNHLVKYQKEKSKNGTFAETFDLDKIKFPIYVRSRLSGDKLQPLGMKSTKKLQDIFVDKGVPKRSRDLIPIVLSEEKLLWIVGHQIADWSKITTNTKNLLEIKFTKTH